MTLGTAYGEGGLASLQSLFEVESSGSVNGAFVATFDSGNGGGDTDAWRQGNDQDFVVPPGKGGRYLITFNASTDGANRLAIRIEVNGTTHSQDGELTTADMIHRVACSTVIELVPGDIVTFEGFTGAAHTVTGFRITIDQLSA